MRPLTLARNRLMSRQQMAAMLRASGLGLLGGLVFHFAALPLPWMLGPLVANLIGAMAGMRLAMPNRLRELGLGTMGLILGGRVTSELVDRLPDWSISLLLLSAGVTVSTYLVTRWYQRCGLDTAEAFFSASPGGLAAMVMLGERLELDTRGIAISQSLRVVLVLLVLPPLFWLLEGGASATSSVMQTGWQDAWLLLLLIVAPFGHRLRIPSPALLVPLILGATLSASDIGSLHLPDWMMAVVLVVLGSAIGSRFSGTTVKQLLDYGKYALVATILTLGVLSLFAEAIHQLLGIPRDIALLALAPGGMAEMAVLAVALDMDPLYVTFHHMFRLIALMVLAPLIATRLNKYKLR